MCYVISYDACVLVYVCRCLTKAWLISHVLSRTVKLWKVSISVITLCRPWITSNDSGPLNNPSDPSNPWVQPVLMIHVRSTPSLEKDALQSDFSLSLSLFLRIQCIIYICFSCDIRTLRELRLHSNHLTSLADLSYNSQLSLLYINDNKLQDLQGIDDCTYTSFSLSLYIYIYMF